MNESYVRFGKLTCPYYDKGECKKVKKPCDGKCEELVEFLKLLKL